jgi:hypothetical protein
MYYCVHNVVWPVLLPLALLVQLSAVFFLYCVYLKLSFPPCWGKSLLYFDILNVIFNFYCVFRKVQWVTFHYVKLNLKCYIASSHIMYLVHSKFLSLTVTVLVSVHGSESVYSVARECVLMAYCECLSISVGEKYFCKIFNYSSTSANTWLCNKLGSCCCVSHCGTQAFAGYKPFIFQLIGYYFLPHQVARKTGSG